MIASLMKAIIVGLMGITMLTGCTKDDIINETIRTNETQKNDITNEMSEKTEIVINEIEDLASAKIMAESKVIEKDNLPDDLRYIVELKMPSDIKISLISEVYTKSDMAKEDFDVLHDYSFLYSNDEERSVKINLSIFENPLRDYFFQGGNEVSKVNGVDVTISKYENKYIARFSFKDIQYDVETNGLSQDEMIEVIKGILKGE